jgi:L-threonylcarbamoyladenylate synthase
MKTDYIKIDPLNPEQKSIDLAASLIKSRELVAFPTETVYGLGADAFCLEAVGKIFKAKGRPPEHPLLVHVSNLEQVYPLVEELPNEALKLMEEFWPGPLSIILPASQAIPDIVRGGLRGVGLRMPDHRVALGLIDQTGPLAAPSANRYGRPSPITAQDVKEELDGRIAAVLDAGPTGIGLESTIIDMQDEEYKLLRRGGIPLERIERVLGKKLGAQEVKGARPYLTTLAIYLAHDFKELDLILQEAASKQKKTAMVNYTGQNYTHHLPLDLEYELDMEQGGVQLYSIIRECEAEGIDQLVFAPLPSPIGGIAATIIDRIVRAASSQD